MQMHHCDRKASIGTGQDAIEPDAGEENARRETGGLRAGRNGCF